MENTLKNKAAFIAQYWGQRVFVGHVLEEVNSSYIDPMYETSILELKSIEDITDEELLHISKICFRLTDNTFKSPAEYNEQIEAFGFFMDEEIDYLREKGYAVPYRGLSVQKLVEYGWIKLKNKES